MQRFSANALEAKHRLQKKAMNGKEIPKEIVAVTECLGKWVASYYTQARRAIQDIGKYKLAPKYEHFYVEPVQWVQWLDDRRNQHFNAFMRERPQIFAYKKPKEAEKKPGGTGKNKRRAGLPQPQLFSEIPENQQARPDQRILVTPIKVRRTGVDEAQWEVKYSLFVINYSLHQKI